MVYGQNSWEANILNLYFKLGNIRRGRQDHFIKHYFTWLFSVAI